MSSMKEQAKSHASRRDSLFLEGDPGWEEAHDAFIAGAQWAIEAAAAACPRCAGAGKFPPSKPGYTPATCPQCEFIRNLK